MTRYLLDSNIWIGMARGDESLLERIRLMEPPQIVTCSVVRAELAYGARKSRQVEKNLVGFQRLLDPVDSLAFDDLAADHYGMIRADLERAGTPIGAADLMIASIARSRDVVMVTRNVNEFVRVVGLRVEEW
ncbi:MAG: type II toxin-antitoxin system VapC family toxin [Bryobacteraceae bacterium]